MNLPQPANPTFEADTPGAPPMGWNLGSQGQAEVAVIAGDAAFAGEQAARVTVLRPATGRGLSANLMQGLDAEDWGGRRVRLRAAIRADGLTEDSRVQMWFRVDRPEVDGKRQFGAFDNMGDRPITAEEWRHYDIVLDVDDDASRIVVGVFLIGAGGFWLDDVSLTEVDKAVESTAGGSRTPAKKSSPTPAPTRDPLITQALSEAENAPQQPFWTWWLMLPATLIGLSILAFWPRWSAAANGDGAGDLGFVLAFAQRFTVLYWVGYGASGFVTTVFRRYLPSWSMEVKSWTDDSVRELATWTAHNVFAIEGELVPPNGSGDTTQSYLALLNLFVVALFGAVIWTAIARRVSRRTYSVTGDLMRSYLRYLLAFVMLSYGMAKLPYVSGQFRPISEYGLATTWGDCSPMGVVWKFMGSSPAYTAFAGIGETLGALLLVWRRTATLGAVVTCAVMTNVAMLNYCYDVPVKLYSSHLVVMALLIAINDGRLLSVLLFGRATDRIPGPTLWDHKVAWWVGLLGKITILGMCFGRPLYDYGVRVADRLAEEPTVTTKEGEKPAPSHRLTSRGYRWINEVPFGR
ncbi:MAG: hypothetical protein NXI31_10320 [bacterium]|nr:hypothetical protein [bacterium]